MISPGLIGMPSVPFCIHCLGNQRILGCKGIGAMLTAGSCVSMLLEHLHAHRAMAIDHTMITRGAYKRIFLLNMILQLREFPSAFWASHLVFASFTFCHQLPPFSWSPHVSLLHEEFKKPSNKTPFPPFFYNCKPLAIVNNVFFLKNTIKICLKPILSG